MTLPSLATRVATTAICTPIWVLDKLLGTVVDRQMCEWAELTAGEDER